MIDRNDTIAAVATASGDGGVAVIRISGGEAFSILKRAFQKKSRGLWRSMRLYYGQVTDDDGAILDEAMAVYMRAPHTYTREDVAEIQCHGGHVVTQRVLARVLALGARPAEAGEFTRRAFLNGRIDLAEAEAVMQLIASGSEAAARASVRQLSGGVSGFVRKARETLIGMRAAIEAATDFPDEVDETETAGQVRAGLTGVICEIEARSDARGARMVRDGVSVVLCGRPNAGKSSILNALLAQDAAIVTDVPGTTRDVLTCRMQLGGVQLDISDTAGQRDTDDAVEMIGVERAKNAEKQADVPILVLDASNPPTAADEARLRECGLILGAPKNEMPAPSDSRFGGAILAGGFSENRAAVGSGAERSDFGNALSDGIGGSRYLAVLNKWDAADDGLRTAWRTLCPTGIPVSAKTLYGLESLLEALRTACRSAEPAENGMTLQRHIRAAQRCAEALRRGIGTIDMGMPLDMVSADIREGLDALGEITGENLSEQVIDDIFKNFCVGK